MTTSATDLRSIDDVVSYLKDQHSRIKEQLPTVLEAEGPARATAFAGVRQTLAIHEAFEQVVIHPHARPDAGADEVSDRVDEEEEAGNAISDLESLDVGSKEFHDLYSKFMLDVVEHAEHEEHEEFAEIKHQFTEAELVQVRAAVQLAESSGDAPAPESTFEAMLSDAKAAIAGAHA